MPEPAATPPPADADAASDAEAAPSSLAVVEEWRVKCSSISTHSSDALVPVLSKGFDALAAALRPGSTHNEFLRTLGSLDAEHANSLKFDGRKDTPVRSLAYGLLESVHRTLGEISEHGWTPGWVKPERAGPAPVVAAPPPAAAAAEETVDGGACPIPSQSATVQIEDEHPLPLFASLSSVDLGVKREVPSSEDGEERLPRSQMTPARASRSDFPLASDSFPGFGAEHMERGDDDEEDDPLTEHVKDFLRARSEPAGGEANDESEGALRVPRPKRRGPSSKRGALGCPLCDWHHGNSPGTVISHLRVHHGSTPATEGIYFRCTGCGHASRSNNHGRTCATPAFAVVRDADEMFVPKTRRSSNTPRRPAADVFMAME